MTELARHLLNLLFLSFAVAACLALCPSASQAIKEKPVERSVVILNFPPDRSLGTLKINLYKRNQQTGRVESKSEKIQFKGTVNVPIGMTTTFKLSYDGAEQLKTLAKIVGKYEIIYCFDSDSQPLTDKQVAEIAKISSIKRLDLSHTDTSDAGIAALLPLKDLWDLSLSATTITAKGTAILPQFQKLTVVDIEKNELDDTVGKELSRLPGVVDLGLSATKISDACLSEIAKMKTLTQLKIANNSGITDKGIAKLVTLKNLTQLDVTDTAVTTKGLEVFKPMPLKILKVRNHKFTKAQLARLQSVFPKTEIKDETHNSRVDDKLFAPLHSPFEKGPGF